MSLQLLHKVKHCRTCSGIIPEGREGGGRNCDKCKYARRKMLLKLKRLRQKKCHNCGGMVLCEGVHCSEYCKWIKTLDWKHHKIIKRISDL